MVMGVVVLKRDKYLANPLFGFALAGKGSDTETTQLRVGSSPRARVGRLNRWRGFLQSACGFSGLQSFPKITKVLFVFQPSMRT